MNDFKRDEIRQKAAIVTNYTLCLRSYDNLLCKTEDNNTKLDELCEPLITYLKDECGCDYKQISELKVCIESKLCEYKDKIDDKLDSLFV